MTAASNPHIVAHELAHVVQQHTGQTAGLAGAGGKAERRRLEQQAESAARDILGRAG